MEDPEETTYREIAEAPSEPMQTVYDPAHSDFVDGNQRLVEKLYKLDNAKRTYRSKQQLQEELQSLSD